MKKNKNIKRVEKTNKKKKKKMPMYILIYDIISKTSI